MSSLDKRLFFELSTYREYADQSIQCDTFSRSTDAVFELSMRFAEPFRHDVQKNPRMTEDEKLEAERLMFHELAQSKFMFDSSGHWCQIVAL